MSQLIPFESAQLPAHLAAFLGAEDNSDLTSGGGGGFPTISIKGKVFHIKRGDELTLVTKPGEDDPAASIEVVILKAGPPGGKSAKVFYAQGYTEGSEDKPTCYSNDGVSPEADAAEPQAAKCAICPQNVWGSKISDNGKQTRACGDSKRLAVASPSQINDPMLLRVPAASLKALTQYSELLAKRGVGYRAVVTKIGFDYTVAHPQITFKPVGFIDEATANEVAVEMNSDIVNQITGYSPIPKADRGDEFSTPKPAATPAPAPAPKPAAAKPAPKPAAKPKPAAAPAAEPDDLPTAPRATVKVESAPAEVVEADGSIGGALDAALASLNFDD